MNPAPKTSLRLVTSALALAVGLAMSTVSGAAVAAPANELGYQRTDVVRAPVTRRGGAPERGVETAFGPGSERSFDVASAPTIGRGGAPERGVATDFGPARQRFDVARAPVTRRGGAPAPATGGAWTGLAAGY